MGGIVVKQVWTELFFARLSVKFSSPFGEVNVQQAIIQLANTAIAMSTPTQEYNFPVKGCMFFGVPNRGTEMADTASSILKVLNTVFNVNRNVVHDLENKSQRLANISMEFRTIRHTHSIPVISFFETVRYNYALGVVSHAPFRTWK